MARASVQAGRVRGRTAAGIVVDYEETTRKS